MARGASEFDKFVNTFLATQKNAREAASADARSRYYDALATNAVGLDPEAYQNLFNGNKSKSVTPSTDEHEGMANLPTEVLPRSREVIAQLETGGKDQPYSVVVPLKHKNGSADEALGRYGVLSSNLPNWSQTHLGKKITKEEFLSNPELQDKIFDGEFGSYLAKTKKPELAAAMWLGGPNGIDNKAADKFGSTPSGYSEKFSKAFYPGRRGPTDISLPPKAPTQQAAIPSLAAAPLPSSLNKPAQSSLPPFYDGETEVAVPTNTPRNMDYLPAEVREKATAGGVNKPQALLEDDELYSDANEYASHGGVIGKSRDYPLHHVVKEAMSHTQDMYGLNAVNGGAIQQPEYAEQIKAFNANSYAPSPQAMNSLLENFSSDGEPIGAAMRGVYAHFAGGGDVRSARDAVAGLLQGARRQAMGYGDQALSAHGQGDHNAALKNLISAYNMVPDGHSFTGEVNHNGFGRGQFINRETGRTIQEVPLTPEVIKNSAEKFSSGSGFYPHLAYALEQGQQVKKFYDAGLVDRSGISTGYELNSDAGTSAEDYEDQQIAQDAALAPKPEQALQPTQISEQELSDRLSLRNSALKPPAEPDFIQIDPRMNATQRAGVNEYNRRLFNNYRIQEQEYRQQVGQENAKERISIRQQFQEDQARARREVAEEQRKLRTNPGYAFQKDVAPLVERYNSLDGVDRQKTGLDIMNARAAFEMRGLKQTAKERDPEHLEAQIDDAWKKLNGLAKEDPNVKRSDGSNMTNVKDRAYVELDKLPSVKNEFYDVMYGLIPLNEGKHTPQSIMQVVHDIAFKKSAKPEFNPEEGTIKLGGVSLVVPGNTWQRIIEMRNEARVGQKEIENARAVRLKKDEEAPQRRSEAISMRPADLSVDQQYAIKYGLNPNTSPEEVDKRRTWGALQ